MINEYGTIRWANSAGEFHREDGPAVEWATGCKEWYLNGYLHRSDGPAIETSKGTKFWYLNGKPHRTDGPAVEWINGNKEWWLGGYLHRTDGPAIIHTDGDDKWYLRNKKVSKSGVITYVCQQDLKVLLLTRVVDPFCEINVAKHVL